MISIVPNSEWTSLEIQAEQKQDKSDRMEAAAKAVKERKDQKDKKVSVEVSQWINMYGVEALADLIQGMMLANYEQIRFPRREREELQIELTGVEESLRDRAEMAVKEAEILTQSIMFARDLVNLPANYLRPADFVREVSQKMEGTGVEVEYLDREALIEQGLNTLLAVGDASAFPPYLLILRYHNAPENSEVLGMAGKGVTFDTGGYCLKSDDSMTGMNDDMAGGAAVAGAIWALARNHVKTNVVGVIPLCENRISPGGLLIGDVITSYSGKTIEVNHTDAEGRLILADAVSYAVKHEKVTKIVDIATLTGDVVRTLGFGMAGVVASDDEMWSELMDAAEQSGERFWRFPVGREYEKKLESDIADIRNSSRGKCVLIAGGLFIRFFTENKPWLHLDIAGTAWVDTPLFEYQSKRATGFGVTTLYELAKGMKREK
ncbi:MAG: M17 family metallopeptidase [Lachnospiraceae bacterium]|nr:leucyl aminopeptidase family protein [Robinsoniella sp.]MDY3766438.1 M17 family metallopeptidase [Lachnospiraceae bacterium]